MIDINGHTWHEVMHHVNERLQACRDKLETQLPELETAKVRGEIAALKSLLSLPQLLEAKVIDGGLGYEIDD